MKNLWMLSEERPKPEVIKKILKFFCERNGLDIETSSVKVTPVFQNKKFCFRYEVEGFSSKHIKNIFIKIASGYSSFVDYLLFLQDEEPASQSRPLLAVEETKTDDSESRNTGVYQRGSKFIYIDFFYPGIEKVMLYDIKVPLKKPSATGIFGTNMLLALGVTIVGKKLDKTIFRPFKNVDELIAFKKKMRKAHKNNVPIQINKKGGTIYVSGRLIKAGGLAHDPNIGSLSLICGALRKLGWEGAIIITHHGLLQKHITENNKFVKIASKLNVGLEGLKLPDVRLEESTYWHYENKSEKLATILLAIIVERYSKGFNIYENHAGCERGYLYGRNQIPLVVEKYQAGKRSSYKRGNKKAIIFLPDLAILDPDRKIIITAEGKKLMNFKKGIKELKSYKYIEQKKIKPIYEDCSFCRILVIYGGTGKKSIGPVGLFQLDTEGSLFTNPKTPSLITKVLKKLTIGP